MDNFLHLDNYLSSGSNGEPVSNKASDFELAVCKSQEGTVLKKMEKILNSLNNDDVEESNSSFAGTVLVKKMKTSIDLKWIPRLPIARNFSTLTV